MKDLKLNDVIKLSDSLYNSPGLFSKNQTQTAKRRRMVIDFGILNKKTIGNLYPLPNITEILDQLESAKYLVYSILHHLGLAFTKYAQKNCFFYSSQAFQQNAIQTARTRYIAKTHGSSCRESTCSFTTTIYRHLCSFRSNIS